MSWSFHGVGKPMALKAAIMKAVEGHTPGSLSRAEFEHAAAHLKGLLDAAAEHQAVSINASGYATGTPEGIVPQNIQVEIRQLGPLYE